MQLRLLLVLHLLQQNFAPFASAVHFIPGSTRQCRLESPPISSLSCSGSDVTEVPTIEAGAQVKIFFIEACPISTIGPNSFANVTGTLTLLNIRTTVPMYLSDDAFSNLGSLKDLLVIAPQMQEMPADLSKLLRSLVSLKFLTMENIRLGHLPGDFATNTKITDLRIINANIVSVATDAFVRFSSLSILDLSRNPAQTYVNDLLRQVSSVVQNITMTECSLTQIRTIASFNRLVKINMDKNRLSMLDLRSLSGAGATLEELSLNSNELGFDSLPGLELMTALRRLYLVNNLNLKEMPLNIGQLEGLEVLDARLTAIENIRVGDFHERSRLMTLKLLEAPIILIELTAFQRLTRLSELLLTLPASAILFRSVADKQPASWSDLVSRLPALRNLSLAGLTSGTHGSLDDSIWPGLTSCQQIRRLTLDFNAIATVPDFQFAANRIEYLSLQGNRIASLNSASLYGLAPTAQLTLKDNELSSLDNCSLAGLTTLSGVDLSGNPWRCDCSLVWLLERLRAEAGPNTLKAMNCQQPDSLRGRPWSDLSSADFCPSSAAAVAVAPCEVRTPTTTALPTPTAFPYPLDIQISLDPNKEQLLVRVVVNASGLASRFDRYTVRFGPEREYAYSSRVQEAVISVSLLTFHLDVIEKHKFCIILQGPDGAVESPDNCRLFLPSRNEGQMTSAHISAAVIVPIVGLGVIAIVVFCVVSRRARQREIKAAMVARQSVDDENQYSPMYSDDTGNPRFQSARKPESRRFTKRNGSNLEGSRPSLVASNSNLQTQIQIQQLQQLQQFQAQQRMHSMSLTGGRQSDPWDQRAMRGARSTDQLSASLGGHPLNSSGRARSQEFMLDHVNLQRSRSGFNQADEDAPPPLPARNPSRMALEPEEEYEQMDA